MTCVQALLQGELLSSDQLSAMLEDLLPKMLLCRDWSLGARVFPACATATSINRLKFWKA
ncbi:hypothetical protein GBAR_LOCUS9865 [Geodia barretti]|uniref:Uncharacterized protein n=1 Tax=Geodia barretti TaxID=519541 RepID=A0AA35RRR3_GEOBA|nr:hypothetical protein GBAR_LOCUS9865 [Geodia barretti]